MLQIVLSRDSIYININQNYHFVQSSLFCIELSALLCELISFLLSLVDDTKILQEDAKILKVIESYCTSARARRTVNSCKYVHGVSVCGCVSNYGFW